MHTLQALCFKENENYHFCYFELTSHDFWTKIKKDIALLEVSYLNIESKSFLKKKGHCLTILFSHFRVSKIFK